MSEQQTFISHLIELRSRLIKAVVTIVIIVIIQLPFASQIYSIMAQPVMAYLPEGSSMIATGVLSPFLTPFKMVFILGLIISMPVILYQIWAFIAPGLYKHEKKIAKPLLFSSILLFYLGCLFAYFVIFPILFQFIPSLSPAGVDYMPDINSYLDIMIRLFFAFGIAFEMPIAVILMILMGVTTPEKLTKNRPYVIVGVFVIGMILTPPDMISQTLMAIPMWLLFEIGIIMGRILKNRQESKELTETPDS
ncbi:Twin-arginine translocation protein TatC [hydrothermal vent metagenome]|uniref:Twin-arginine translocation protein TatC n=1 Tax=hydrothermal vent metagenome TaxID=652676 RepID=A0A3B0V4X0_9ZZZZ